MAFLFLTYRLHTAPVCIGVSCVVAKRKVFAFQILSEVAMFLLCRTNVAYYAIAILPFATYSLLICIHLERSIQRFVLKYLLRSSIQQERHFLQHMLYWCLKEKTKFACRFWSNKLSVNLS